MRPISEQKGKDILLQVLTEVREQREEMQRRMSEFSSALGEFKQELRTVSANLELIRAAYVNLGSRINEIDSRCIHCYPTIPDNGGTLDG